MDKKGLIYNSERGELIIPEYGRNIQAMIQHLVEIEDREKRTEAAHFIVSIMAQMHPNVKDTNDYIHKLWDHMYIISDFKLDVDGPFDPPKKEEQTKPQHIGYQNNHIKYGHYGQLVVEMINAICEQENEPEQLEALSYSIANQMKRDYLSWNKDNVSDTIIIDDLRNLSHGKLDLPDTAKLISTNEILGRPSMQQQNNQGKKKKKTMPMQKQNYNRNGGKKAKQ